MKKNVLFGLIVLGVAQGVAFEATGYSNELYVAGEKSYDKNCLSCHVKTDYSFSQLGENFSNNNAILKLKAPVLNQLSFRLKQELGDKNDAESQLFEIGEYIKDYSLNPNKSKAVCMDIVIRNFDTMPSLRGKVSDKELEEVSHFIYWYDIKKKNKK